MVYKVTLAQTGVIDWGKVRYPILQMPKIDGVRAHHQGGLLARSLDPFANEAMSEFYDNELFANFDGEMAAEYETHPQLSNLTSSAVNTQAGNPFTVWHLFDDMTDRELGYQWRHEALCERYLRLPDELRQRTRVIPYKLMHSEDQVCEEHLRLMSLGYEGSILRAPEGRCKDNRSTMKENILLRIKDFASHEAVVLHVEEGETNLNEATINARGYTKRSTHKENMVPNGRVGALWCRLLTDVLDIRNHVLFKAGMEFRMSKGRMTVAQCEAWFKDQTQIVGKTVTFNHMLAGAKDVPRKATFQCIRALTDM